MLSLLLAQTDIPSAADAAAASAVAGTGLAIWGGLMIFWFIFWGLSFVIWLWALIDVIRRNFTNQSDKTLWLIIVLLVPLGALIYLIVGRKKGTIA